MGVWPSSLHVFCGLGEGLRPCPLGSTLEGTAGAWGIGATAASYPFPVPLKWELCPYTGHKVKYVSRGCWTPSELSLVSDPVCDIHGQDLEAQPWWGVCPVQEPQNCVAALCRWCCFVGFFCPWPPADTVVFCSWVWSSRDEGQYLQVRGRKMVDCTVQLGDELLSQATEFSRAGAGDGKIAWCGFNGNAGTVPDRRGEEGAELEGKAWFTSLSMFQPSPVVMNSWKRFILRTSTLQFPSTH